MIRPIALNELTWCFFSLFFFTVDRHRLFPSISFERMNKWTDEKNQTNKKKLPHDGTFYPFFGFTLCESWNDDEGKLLITQSKFPHLISQFELKLGQKEFMVNCGDSKSKSSNMRKNFFQYSPIYDSGKPVNQKIHSQTNLLKGFLWFTFMLTRSIGDFFLTPSWHTWSDLKKSCFKY